MQDWRVMSVPIRYLDTRELMINYTFLYNADLAVMTYTEVIFPIAIISFVFNKTHSPAIEAK